MHIRFLTLAIVALCGAEAFANNYFIPNYYRNRRALNNYSAVGWSNRKEAGVGYSIDNTDSKSGGTKVSKDQDSTIRPYTYYRMANNVNIEAAIMRMDNESKAQPSGAKTKVEGMEYQLGAGYELTGTPMAFGVILNKSDSDTKPPVGGKTSTDGFSGALGVGYRLDNDIYVGAGYTNSRSKVKGAKEDQDNSYAIGAGKVMGDRANPEGAAEAVLQFQNEDSTQVYDLTLQGLMNASADFQYYGMVGFMKGDGNVESTGFSVMAGADYKFMDFYVGPQLTFVSLDSKIKGAASKTEGTVLSPSLEVGYRIDILEVALRYDMVNTDMKTAGTKGEMDSNVLAANLAYKF